MQRPGLVSLCNNFLSCALESTINVHVVGGGSEENVNSCDCWLLLAVSRAGKMNSSSRKSGINVDCAHKKCNVHIEKAQTPFTFVESPYFAICSLIFHSKISDNEHFCLGLDAVVLIPQSTWRSELLPLFLTGSPAAA